MILSTKYGGWIFYKQNTANIFSIIIWQDEIIAIEFISDKAANTSSEYLNKGKLKELKKLKEEEYGEISLDDDYGLRAYKSGNFSIRTAKPPAKSRRKQCERRKPLTLRLTSRVSHQLY